MTGYLLGTGSGILAAAATYYTLSTSIRQTTDSLQDEIHRSAHLLSSSFDPQTPPAPSSFVGPSYPSSPSFSDTLRSRWNLALARGFDSVRETNWAALGLVVVDETGKMVKRLSSEVQALTDSSASSSPNPASSSSSKSSSGATGSSVAEEAARAVRAESTRLVDDIAGAAHKAKQEVEHVEQGVKSWWPKFKGAVQEAETEFEVVGDELRQMVRKGELVGEKIDASGTGVVGGDVRKESYIGGREEWVRAKRQVEKLDEGRLV